MSSLLFTSIWKQWGVKLIMDLTEQGILYMKISPVVFQYLNFHIYCGGMCGRAVNTSNSRSKGSGFKPCPSHCFLRQLYGRKDLWEKNLEEGDSNNKPSPLIDCYNKMPWLEKIKKRGMQNTAWHEIFVGVYFCGLTIFCVLWQLIFAIRTDWFFLLGINFCDFQKVPSTNRNT